MHKGIEGNIEDIAVKTIYELSRIRKNQVQSSSLRSMGVGYTQHCGDELELFVQEEGGHLYRGEYRGDGCMIMHASTHILCMVCQSISVGECVNLLERVLLFFRGDSKPPLSELEIFSNIRHSHIRKKCALLPWQLMLRALIEIKG